MVAEKGRWSEQLKGNEFFKCPLDYGLLNNPVYIMATSMLERGIPEEQLQTELEALGFEFPERAESGY